MRAAQLRGSWPLAPQHPASQKTSCTRGVRSSQMALTQWNPNKGWCMQSERTGESLGSFLKNSYGTNALLFLGFFAVLRLRSRRSASRSYNSSRDLGGVKPRSKPLFRISKACFFARSYSASDARSWIMGHYHKVTHICNKRTS